MISGDVINDWRRLVNEPNTNRFTVQDSIDFLNKAQRQLATEIDFPEATYTISTVSGQREYALTEMIKILRVYIVGTDGSQQILFGTNIGILEGDITESYDNTSGAFLGQPVQSPQWLTQQPQAYPVQSPQIGGIVPTAAGYTQTSRPQYYLRGGNIGLVPTPVAVVTIKVDYVPMPPIVTSLSDTLEFPAHFMDALVYKMAQYSRMADNSPAAVQNMQLYQNELQNTIRPWKDSLQATKPKKFIPITKRSYMPGRDLL